MNLLYCSLPATNENFFMVNIALNSHSVALGVQNLPSSSSWSLIHLLSYITWFHISGKWLFGSGVYFSSNSYCWTKFQGRKTQKINWGENPEKQNHSHINRKWHHIILPKLINVGESLCSYPQISKMGLKTMQNNATSSPLPSLTPALFSKKGLT